MKDKEPASIIHDFFNSIENLIKMNDINEVKNTFKDLANLEESFLKNYRNRKNEGVFYTNEEITNFMVTQALGSYHNNLDVYQNFDEFLRTYSRKSFLALQEVSICDPACGSGAFLLSAAEQLYKIFKYNEPDLDPSKIKAIVLQKLYGYDINVSAIKLCFLKLLNWSSLESSQYISQNFTTLKSNIVRMDSLRSLTKKKFTIIIGNPPYGNILDIEQKNFLKQKNIFYNDIYCAFLLKSIEWTNGIICLLIPKSFLLRQGYVKFREILFSKANLLKIIDIGPNLFKKATNEVQILIFEKKKEYPTMLNVYAYPDRPIVAYKNQEVDELRICFNSECSYNSISKKVYVYSYEKTCPHCNSNTYPLNRIRIKTKNSTLKIIKKLESEADLNYLNIRDYPKMIRGEEDKGLKQIKPLIEKNLNNSCLFINAKEDFHYYYLKKHKSFNIENISPDILKGRNYEYYFKPKLLIKHNSIFPQAIYTSEKVCFTSSIYSLIYDDIQELKYLSALINSAIMQYYCFYAINNQMNTTINLNQYMIRHLPFIDIKDNLDICKYVDAITTKLIQNKGVFNKSINSLVRELDNTIFELYSFDLGEKKEIITNVANNNPFYKKIYS